MGEFMKSKEGSHSGTKPTSKQQTQQSNIPNGADLTEQISPALVQRTRLNPSLLSSKDVLHLQHTIGNQSVCCLLENGNDIIQRSELSDRLGEVWQDLGKGAFFHQLRALTETERDDPDLMRFVQSSLRGDDRWLAQNILSYGAETEWPVHLRVEREMKRWADSGGQETVIRILRDIQGAEAGNTALEEALRRVFEDDSHVLSLALWLQQNKPARLMSESEALGWLRDNGIPFMTDSRRSVAFSPAVTVNFSGVVSSFELHYSTSGERGTHTVTPRLAVALVRLIRFLHASDVKILHHLGVSGGTHAEEGYAIDISGFTFNDDTRILLSGIRRESAWNDEMTQLSNGMSAREFMIHVGEWMANTDFGQILGPGIGRGGHYDHFHVQVPHGRRHRGFVHEGASPNRSGR
jgi:hypothetical protein